MSSLRRAIALATLGTALPAFGQAAPTLVEVQSYRSHADDAEIVGSALGVVVEAEGFLLTTYRSLTDPETGALLPHMTATLASADGDKPRPFPARVVGVEPTLNFAVLKIEAEEAFVPSVVLRDKGLETGQTIYAATELLESGSRDEEGLAVGQLISLNSIECYQESLTQTMYQASMIIPKGGLGSPVFDKSGRVIALYTGYEPPHTDGDQVDDASETHLLPIFLAFNIYDSIKTRQSLESPWTGFSVRSLTDAEATRIPEIDARFKSGIALDYVWPDSPAAELGLREGDILLHFAHHAIASPADFQKWLYMYGVGRDVKMVMLRDDQPFVLKYKIERRPEWAVPR